MASFNAIEKSDRQLLRWENYRVRGAGGDWFSLSSMAVAIPDPVVQLQTLFVTDELGRMVCTREPFPSPAPALVFIRGRANCAWAVGANVPDAVAVEVNRLAAEEEPSADWHRPLRHTGRYAALLGGPVRSGPAFWFPDRIEESAATVLVEDESELTHHFSGWVRDEIAAGRAPVVGVKEGGGIVSVCFCARRSSAAAEAGIETASAFRGRGYGLRVAAAWAGLVRARGLIPLYSTNWSNPASLSVARRLGLVPYAADFVVESSPLLSVAAPGISTRGG